jgi:hypothetical protein
LIYPIVQRELIECVGGSAGAIRFEMAILWGFARQSLCDPSVSRWNIPKASFWERQFAISSMAILLFIGLSCGVWSIPLRLSLVESDL